MPSVSMVDALERLGSSSNGNGIRISTTHTRLKITSSFFK